MDQALARAFEKLKVALPALPAHERHALNQLLGSNKVFSHVCDPQHRDAYRLFCRLVSSGDSADALCDRFTALLAMMEEESFEEFRDLVSLMLRGGLSFNLIGELASKDSFRSMFTRLLDDGWLKLREESDTDRGMVKMLHAEFAYKEGVGPKPLCVVDGQHFVGLLEEGEKVFQRFDFRGPESNDAERVQEIEAFFAKHPNATWKLASEALNMTIQRMKRLRKRTQHSASTASSGPAPGKTADVKLQERREVKLSMNPKTLHQNAYTQITFANCTDVIYIFEPSERGRVLWSEHVDSHPFPATADAMDSLLKRKWSVFTKSGTYQTHGPETVLGRFLHGSGVVDFFCRAEAQALYSHRLQRELYELACPWYSGEEVSLRAAQRIKRIGQELYEMGEDAFLDDAGMSVVLSMYADAYERTGQLPEGVNARQLANARRLHNQGHAAMALHFIGLGLLSGVFDEVTSGTVPAGRHSLPKERGGIVKMLHTKNLRGELEMTGWQCVVEMLWHGIGQWEN